MGRDDVFGPGAFPGTRVTAADLVALGEFVAPPSHYVSERHLRETAEALTDWCDDDVALLGDALHLAVARRCRATVVSTLRQASHLDREPSRLAEPA